MTTNLERAKACNAIFTDGWGRTVIGLTSDQLDAYTAQAIRDAPSKCPGIPRAGCNYITECGQSCNKCGHVHHAHQLSAEPEANLVRAVPLSDEQIADLWDAQLFHITDLAGAIDLVRDVEAAHGISTQGVKS